MRLKWKPTQSELVESKIFPFPYFTEYFHRDPCAMYLKVIKVFYSIRDFMRWSMVYHKILTIFHGISMVCWFVLFIFKYILLFKWNIQVLCSYTVCVFCFAFLCSKSNNKKSMYSNQFSLNFIEFQALLYSGIVYFSCKLVIRFFSFHFILFNIQRVYLVWNLFNGFFIVRQLQHLLCVLHSLCIIYSILSTELVDILTNK